MPGFPILLPGRLPRGSADAMSTVKHGLAQPNDPVLTSLGIVPIFRTLLSARLQSPAPT
jgi:hypothetical protein